MKNRISFCVNACKKSTFRFIGGLQNVLRGIVVYLKYMRGVWVIRLLHSFAETFIFYYLV